MARFKTKVFRPRKDENGNYKEKLCAVCGKPLTPGQPYMNVWNYYNDWSMHTDCYRQVPRSRWETSEYLGRIYDLQDDFAKGPVDIENVLSELDDIQYELQDKLDAMPYQLQDSDSGQLLQERIDNIDYAKSDIESLQSDYDEINERTYEEYVDEFKADNEESEWENIDSEDDWESNKQEELDNINNEVADKLSDLG